MNRVAEARHAAGLSVDKAARAVGISVGYLRQLESSGAAPYRISRRLAKVYGVSISMFIRGRQKPQVSYLPEDLGRSSDIQSSTRVLRQG